MPNLPKFVTRFILPVAFVTTVFQLPVQANTVRIIGPSDDDQPFTVSDRYRDTGVANSYSSNQSASANNLYGPTTANETLWGIASRYRPNNSVSIYQVIGAIHRANPQSFENNNIHGLVPGSQLSMPTMAQIQREDVASVKRRLEADQRRQTRSVSTTSRTTKAVKSSTQSTDQVVATPIEKPEKAKVESVTPPKARSTSKTSASQKSTTERAVIPPKPEPTELQEQLDASDEQMTKLLESNHLLRVRLSEMQYEVSALKSQITDDEALRGEIIGFLEQQKEQAQVQTTDTEPSWFDQFISNPWMLAAAGLIPGGLIAGAIAFFILRRRKDDEDSDIKSLENQEGKELPTAPTPLMTEATDSESDLMLSEDQDIDDLFASDESLFGNPEESLFDNDTNPAFSEMLDDTTSLDLSSELDDEFGLDLDSNSGLSSRSISVKGDDQAIGLEDMERALDQMEPSSELSSDEALAAMWEKSLQEQADDEPDFDLSDDADNEFDSDLMSSNSIEDGLLDQSILDDLLAEVEAENENEDTKNNTTAFSETLEANIEESAASNAEQVVDQSELDALFDSFDSSDTDLSSINDNSDEAEQAAVDQALADAEAMFNPEVVTESDYFSAQESDVVKESTAKQTDFDLNSEADVSDELVFEEGSTALLDDIVEDDEFSSNIEIEENSTALLDELLSDGSTDDAELTSIIEIDENSTALLDELIGDAEVDADDDIDANSFYEEELEDNTELDQLIIDENSTDLLDEILEHKNHVVDADDKVAAGHLTEPNLLDDSIQDEFSDPEFENALSTPLQDQQGLGKEEVTNKPDADFPESEAAAFDAILNEALQSNDVNNSVDEIDALIADVDSEINEIDKDKDESDGNDVETIERSVTDLLEELDAAEALVAENESESKSEEHPIVDLDDFPIFDEEAALSELDERAPAKDSNPIGSQIGESLSVEELPEFDEDTAFNDPEADALEDDLSLLSEDDERIALDNVVRNLQQAVEASESYGNNIAQPPRAEASLEHEPTFEAIDPTTLPEFSEDDALQASLEEQNELEQYELEQGLKVKSPVTQTASQNAIDSQVNAHVPEPVADMFDEDFVDSAGLDMEALLTEPATMFTETVGEQVIAEQQVEDKVLSPSKPNIELDDPIVPEHTKQDAKVSVNQEIEAAERDGLLFDEPLDNTKQDLDLDSFDFMNSDMIEDDSDDLLLPEEDIPEEDIAVWAGSTPEPELESEDWSVQPEMQVEDVTSFDPESLIAESEEPALTFAEPASVLLDEEEPLASPYISIDELMKEEELTNSVDLDTEPLNLDVGLDEFPDVLAGIESYDVDSHGEYSSKLDLAKAYLEMNDAEGAIGLLEEVAQKGDSVSQREAANLLTQYKR
ncbi:FimV/HubP family polar landmark protein [Photobacterium profundum]|uniref:FimV/HubP family polar landmark protein n=1 Tax=Photobacterium profundum TaxID=74109 RepID=UPI003D11A73D